MKGLLLFGSLAAATILSAAAVGYYAYSVNENFEGDKYLAVQDKLRNIRFLEASLDALALRSRHGYSPNYDLLAETGRALSETADQLSQESTLSLFDADSERLLKTYQSQQAERLEIVEDFKSRNSILRNSILYIPQAADKLVNAAMAVEERTVASLVDSTSESLYRWALYGNDADGYQLSQGVARMARFDPNDSQMVLALIEYTAHASTVLNEMVATDDYLFDLLNVPVQETLGALEASLSSAYLLQVEDARKSTVVVYIFGAVVVCIAATFAVLLIGSHARLERRVHERTAEIQLAFQQLQESQEQLIQSEKMASLGQLVAGVAHEMNTPLGYIKGNFETIHQHFTFVDSMVSKIRGIAESVSDASKRSELAPRIKDLVDNFNGGDVDERQDEARELITDCRDGVDDLSGLVSSLREFSRLDRQNYEFIDITSGLESTLKIARKILEDNNAVVVKQYADVSPVHCVASKINQVFLNIITNAAQAMPEGRGGRIEITTIQREDAVSVVFRDNGKGMTDEVKRRIFEPFFTTKDVGQGTGLGMSIAYKIVKEHQGSIDVESEPGVGTTVSITVPTKRASQAERSEAT